MTVTTDFLNQLNLSQRRAVEHFCGPLLVVAGAGSGKTRALTYRIANLILNNHVDPENILAVTFTNKAAREMKERVERLFAEQEALARHGKPLQALSEYEQIQLRSYVYKTFIKHLWIGTFHALCSRILRFDIEKFQSEAGHRWTKTFSIFDESDAQGLVKSIVVSKMNLDDRAFNPRSVRFTISNAKNQGFNPAEYEQANQTFKGRTIAEVYRHYQAGLAENNALDFDDLIRLPVQLFRQNSQVLNYWHRRFRHILVDEYQDTNRTQYDLLRLLTTNGQAGRFDDWDNRSVFVVGDADQSIYSFRAADFTILMGFQDDFGDGLPDDDTRTLVKLEENYRSTSNILDVANVLIENNTERIDKILRATRDQGETIVCYRADDEVAEAEYVVGQIRSLEFDHPELSWGNCAILYRTNAQSRALEEVLTRYSIPYRVVGGLRFYDRREIKDVLAYLRLVANPADSVSLKRVINTPRRGIGKTTIDNLEKAAQELGVPLWEIVSDETSVKTLAGRSGKSVVGFAKMVQSWQDKLESATASEIVQDVLADTSYLETLKARGTEDDLEREQNIQELYNAVLQFEEENEDASLLTFLANASLNSDLEDTKNEGNEVSLMTLHASKGLEFPVVFLVGLEQGLFPSNRSLDDAAAIEEERRLCYVGLTRAQDRLFISHARLRRLYGSDRTPAMPSIFLGELPPEYIQTNVATALPERWTTPQREAKLRQPRPSSNQPGTHADDWTVGEPVSHPAFGQGKVTHIFGAGNKICLAIHFPGLGKKIIDPKASTLERVID